jgi:Xaa-Pro aminopeptidase
LSQEDQFLFNDVLLRIGKQIAKEIDDFFIDNGAEDVAFSTIVASGKNSSMPHAVPTNKKIEAGDPITIDMGCKYKGYCSDMTRTIFAGYVPEEVKPVYELVLKNQRQVINEMKEGVNLKLVSRMVENDFKLHGYDLIHALGHGVGLQIHEFPYASTRVDFVLKNNMIVTDEPGIYIPNQFGVRIEDTVLVNRGMSTSLTKSEKDYVIVDE